MWLCNRMKREEKALQENDKNGGVFLRNWIR
jgi:hypothetical protein